MTRCGHADDRIELYAVGYAGRSPRRRGNRDYFSPLVGVTSGGPSGAVRVFTCNKRLESVGVRGLVHAVDPAAGRHRPERERPASVPPATVGPTSSSIPGDPHGVVLEGEPAPTWIPPTIMPSAWSGWPAEWWPPSWGNGHVAAADRHRLDVSSTRTPPCWRRCRPTSSTRRRRCRRTGSEPGAGDCTRAGRSSRSSCSGTTSCGEAFVLATARYATGWPARFHVVPPWTVEVDMGDGRRRYRSARRTSPATCCTSAISRRSTTRMGTGRSRPAQPAWWPPAR